MQPQGNFCNSQQNTFLRGWKGNTIILFMYSGTQYGQSKQIQVNFLCFVSFSNLKSPCRYSGTQSHQNFQISQPYSKNGGHCHCSGTKSPDNKLSNHLLSFFKISFRLHENLVMRGPPVVLNALIILKIYETDFTTELFILVVLCP